MMGRRGRARSAITGRRTVLQVRRAPGVALAAALVLFACDAREQATDTAQRGEAAALEGGGAGTGATAAGDATAAHDPTPMPAATPAQLRALERAIAPRLTRPEDVVVETRQDGTLVMHPGEGYYHVAAAVLREGGRFELMCLEQPSIGDYAGHDHDGHPGRPAELR